MKSFWSFFKNVVKWLGGKRTGPLPDEKASSQSSSTGAFNRTKTGHKPRRLRCLAVMPARVIVRHRNGAPKKVLFTTGSGVRLVAKVVKTNGDLLSLRRKGSPIFYRKSGDEFADILKRTGLVS